MKVYQFRENQDNFSYLILCEKTRAAAIIDPGLSVPNQVMQLDLARLDLKYIINTHRHSDHTSGNSVVKKNFGGVIVASEPDGMHIHGVGKIVRDGEILVLGNIKLVFMLTPGHTPGGMCIMAGSEALFTVDCLFIGDCGRTDLPGGSDRELFMTMERLKELPDGLTVYPGHDYGPEPCDTLGNQKRNNKCLKANTLEAFSALQ